MAASVNQRQRKDVTLNQIDEQPVRLDMTFTEAFELSLQFVVMVLLLQRFTLT